MFVWMTVRQPGLDTNAHLPFALEAGVSFIPGNVFDPRGLVSPRLRLNFTANPPDILQEGVRRLSRAAREFASRQAAAE
ncbi:hypothetical protein [Microvirga arabica]|uniref:hypothetical protein n=1 Tax=Microvirga arabica TaxID=1128671 RepID=UPI001939C739|nr:hypothetical protein [Microvirga arabica]MBM1174754.1 hypothetical protein [Microvirga arabica]